MNRLAEVLGVQEGQPFRFDGLEEIYRILDGYRWHRYPTDSSWARSVNELTLQEMINHPELIHPLPQYTEQQLTAFRGRIAEGTPWVARNENGKLYLYEEKPKPIKDNCYGPTTALYSLSRGCALYDFVTFENSPIDLREIVKEAEGV